MMNKTKAIVPGSFDPITLGHLDIIKRAAAVFDTVYVMAFVNPNKRQHFTIEQKLAMMRAVCEPLDNVHCGYDGGMLADYCRDHGINVIVKGVRNAADYEYEAEMAEFNRRKNPTLDTMLLQAETGLTEISSSAVFERLVMGMSVDEMVPSEILPLLSEYMRH